MNMAEKFKIASLAQRGVKFNNRLEQRLDLNIRLELLDDGNVEAAKTVKKERKEHWHLYVLKINRHNFQIWEKRGKIDRHTGMTFDTDLKAWSFIKELIDNPMEGVVYHMANLKELV